jgi:argininosuccinate lyase
MTKVRKESRKREREESKMSDEGMNAFGKSSRTGRSPSRSEEGNKSKEMDNEMKTMIREIREDTEEEKVLRKELAAVREENGEIRKELATVRDEMRGREEKWQVEKADWRNMIEEKMEQREKKERKNKIIIIVIGN